MSEVTVAPLPVWKKDATAYERFMELAHMAREQPARFERVAVVWEGEKKDGRRGADYVGCGMGWLELSGLFLLGVRLVQRWGLGEPE